MQRALALILCLSPGAFLASPLTADDIYGAPDPGWYNQGSGWSAESRSGWSDGGYGFESPAAPYGGSGYGGSFTGTLDSYVPSYGSDSPSRYGQDHGYGETWSRWRDRAGDAPAVGQYPDDERRDTRGRRMDSERPPMSPDGYGAPDWAQPRGQDDYGDPYGRGSTTRDLYSEDRFRDPAARGRTWPDRAAQPRYRFRNDPTIERRYRDDTGHGFRFRPLTERERERQRGDATDPRFVDPDRHRRSGRSGAPERDGSFGYEPDAPGDDFYRRYYRSGP